MTRRSTTAVLLALAVLAGCAPRTRLSAGPEPEYHRLGPLDIAAGVQQDGVDVMGMVDVMNTSTQPVLLEYEGGCGLAVLVGGTASLWDEALWWRDHPDICPTDPTTRLEIPARTMARILTPSVTTMQIAGDSIPAGTFPGSVRLRMLQPLDTTLVLPAGPVRLEG
jgi:hypothetical protein